MSNAVVPRISDDDEVTSSVLNTSGPSDFLFVNETSKAPSYNSGWRHDVRAHVRKLHLKQFKEAQRTARKQATIRPKYAPLTTQSLESDASRYSEHNRDCPFPKTRLRFSTRDSGSVSESSTLTKPNESPHSTTSPSAVAGAPEPGELQGDLTTYCKACGRPLSRPEVMQRYLSKDRSLIPRTSTRQIPWKPSPVEVLGAGRIDPFSSLPMDKPSRYSLELIDHAVTCFLPGLLPDEVAPGEVNPLSKAWFKSGLQTPLLFHALVFVGSNHLDFVRWSNIFPNAPEPLSHKLLVIQKVNQALSDPHQALCDEIILAILILASEVFISKKGDSSPFNSPLRSLKWLNIYGHHKPVPQHSKAIADIVTMRGGLETLELIGLAETIVGGDIISSTKSLAKPHFPPLRISTVSIAGLKAWATSPPRPAIQVQASAFQSLKEYGITEPMLQVLDSIGGYTLAVGYYVQGKPFGLSLGVLSRARIAVQQRLLLLQTGEELNITLSSSKLKPNVYECCRLTALIYGGGVVLPVPNSHSLLQELVRRLMTAIRVSDIRTFGVELGRVLLWMLVLGGIAALNTPERHWFASQLSWVLRRLEIGDWEGVEDILGSFLWLDVACGQAGRLLWSEAMAASCNVPLRLSTSRV